MRSWVDNQYHNLFLYVPFLLAGGAATYFALPFEPNLMLACGIMGIMGTALCFKNIPILIRAILIFCVGLFYACVFTEFIDTPKLVHDKHNLEISGTVQNIDYTDEKSANFINGVLNAVKDSLDRPER